MPLTTLIVEILVYILFALSIAILGSLIRRARNKARKKRLPLLGKNIRIYVKEVGENLYEVFDFISELQKLGAVVYPDSRPYKNPRIKPGTVYAKLAVIVEKNTIWTGRYSEATGWIFTEIEYDYHNDPASELFVSHVHDKIFKNLGVNL